MQRNIRYIDRTDSLLFILTAQTENGCEASDSMTVRFEETPGKNLLSLGQNLKIYPNPVKDYLFWSMDQSVEGTLEVRLTDGKSALMFFEKLQGYHAGEQHPVNMAGFTGGNYLLTIKTGEAVYNEKIIKK